LPPTPTYARRDGYIVRPVLVAPSGTRQSFTGVTGTTGVRGEDNGSEGADAHATDDLSLLPWTDDDADSVTGGRGGVAGDGGGSAGAVPEMLGNSLGIERTEDGRRWYALGPGNGDGGTSKSDNTVRRGGGPLDAVSEGWAGTGGVRGLGGPGGIVGGDSGIDLGKGRRKAWLRTVTVPDGRRTK
jgi:hypothetical protein